MHNTIRPSISTRRALALALAPLTVLAVVGCSDMAGTNGATKNVTFSVSTAGSAMTAASFSISPYSGASFTTAPAAAGAQVVSGNDTLTMDSVSLVLRKAVLARAADTSCAEADHEDEHDGDCDALKAGPILVNIPLDTGVKQVFAVPVPKGSYTGIGLLIHRLSSDTTDTAAVAFLKAHPEFEGASVRVVGAFDSKPFTWTGRPTFVLHERFNPPVQVSDTSGLNFTMNVDVSSWFKNWDGSLINPSTATTDQDFIIDSNIRHSVHAFDDDHRDGRDDHEHDSEGGH